jgi:hypothetical protein
MSVTISFNGVWDELMQAAYVRVDKPRQQQSHQHFKRESATSILPASAGCSSQQVRGHGEEVVGVHESLKATAQTPDHQLHLL